jgi:hypothetical protein
MALRLHRVTDEQWQRLAAARRAEDLAHPPARAAIGAIEVELRSLDASPDTNTDTGSVRAAATG